MAYKVQVRRDTSDRWLSFNPILADGEIGYEKDTGFIKLGDGLTTWDMLDYIEGDTREALIDHIISKANPHEVTKAQIGLGDVDNTSDINKPISTAAQAEFDKKVDKVTGKGLSDENYTLAEKQKLAGVEEGAEANTVDRVAGKTGTVTLDKSDVGLGNVDNTSDLNKPISTAAQAEFDKKVDKVTGKQLSTEDYTTVEKSKLAGVESGATADQTAEEIKTAYEDNADTNAYTDAEKAKLLNVEANAKDDQAAAEVPITDTGEHFTSADVEGALQETGERLTELDNTVGSIEEQLSLNIFRYGIKIDKNDSNPDTRVDYLYDAVGMNPGYMDYATGEFNYGSWRKFAEWVNTPVMLNYEGTVAYELDRNDQTLKADGTASDIDNPNFAGNAMSQFRRMWLNQYEDATHEYYIFSNVKYNEDYQAYAFTDKDGNINDYMYRAMFDGYYDGTRLRSIATGAAMASQTGQTEIVRAEANGPGWNISYKSQRDFITNILWLISKSTNTQDKYGNGNSNSGAYINPGALKSSGQFIGYNTETQAVKVFFIEHFWGNYWERLAGHIMDLDGQVYTKLTPPYPQPGGPGENVMPAGYTPTGVTPSGASGGYIISGKSSPETGFVPAATGGSATTYYCDGMWYTIGSTIKWARVGGARSFGGRCGASAVALGNPLSHADSSSGAALSFLENAS